MQCHRRGRHGGRQDQPVSADVFWNSALHPNTFKVILEPGASQSDITAQFSAPSSSADSHSTAQLSLTPGQHTLEVGGELYFSTYQSFKNTGATRHFSVANASPAARQVTYEMKVFNIHPGFPAGSLGAISFGGSDPNAPNRNVNLIFKMVGNTADVVLYHAPRPCRPNCTNNAVNDGDGFEIVAGTATVTFQNAQTGATIATATFVPGARIFVSVDNGNRGIGFGSLGALPTDPTFPAGGVEVAYPYAQFSAPPTDLISNYSTSAIWALSCVGFNGSPGAIDPAVGNCNLPLSLGTTAGTLVIQSNGREDTAPPGGAQSIFTVTVAP